LAFSRPGYGVEHVVFQSRPGYFVTANLFVPDGITAPRPAVLYIVGHYPEGKAARSAQEVCSALARQGFVVLCADPVGQGERDEYADFRTGRRTVARACRMHAVAGDPAYLLAINFASYRLWDSMRCLDYLCSRPEVDGGRLGVMGTSGGGWESLWLAAMDTRLRAVNSNCYFTTWARRMENRLADAEPDPEQDPVGVLSRGLDASDLLIACAPRAVSLGVTTDDFFPLDGALQGYREARRIFKLAGLADCLSITVDKAGHLFTPAMRQAGSAWMRKWLGNRRNPAAVKPSYQVEKEPDTFCTKTGVVSTSIGGITTAQLNAVVARDLALQRQKAGQAKSPALRQKALRRELWRLLVLPDTADRTRNLTINGNLWRHPSSVGGPACIYLAEKDIKYQPGSNPAVRLLVNEGLTVLDQDPVGMGPGRDTMFDFVPMQESALNYNAFLLGAPLLGIRVWQVLRARAMLQSDPRINASRVYIFGEGYGALLGLLAAAVEPAIAGLIEYRALTSWSSLVWNREYAWPVNMILPGALRHFDLDDLRASLAPRPLVTLEPQDHLKRRKTGK
jgi:dienelactone hydrolase